MKSGIDAQQHIPLLKAKLPSTEKIMPYFKRIDESRWYVNFGPLLKEFEERLTNHFKLDIDQAVTLSNGTLALTAALMALEVPRGSLCIMPSWTFSATPAACCAAGLVPYFVDVDKNTQALQPAQLLLELEKIPGTIGAVIVVSPFGAPVACKEWDEFTEKTGIPVLIDAAASFETITAMPEMATAKTPMMVSLHATKIFGIGEGGLILSKNTDLIKRIRFISCFGFNAERESAILGLNAKLSEYSAAIGLAELDEWENIRKENLAVRNTYLEFFHTFGIKTWLSNEWVSATCNIVVPHQAQFVHQALINAKIDNRRWWGDGCHQHRAYKDFPRAINLTNTAWLAQSIVSLPFAPDLNRQQIERICTAVHTAQNQISLSETEKI